MNRSQETANAAPSDDCVITMVVIGAQYASERRHHRATSNEATTTAAVRTECTTTGHGTSPRRSFTTFSLRRGDSLYEDRVGAGGLRCAKYRSRASPMPRRYVEYCPRLSPPLPRCCRKVSFSPWPARSPRLATGRHEKGSKEHLD